MSPIPSVAVIMRTKNRPILLRRAVQSVLAQEHADWHLVIVNDGGEPVPVNEVVKQVEGRLQGRCTVVHNPHSVGMEAASNVGIRSSASRFVVIHDDDDSWEPAFLSRTVAYLEAPPPMLRTPLGGVVTHSMHVQETIAGDCVTVNSREPFNAWLKGVSLSLLAARNMFPPISFVFRRDVLDAVGLFREELLVLGDWDFNLRVAERFEIGVIQETLANYHHRRATGNYENSVAAANDKYPVYDVLLRNDYLRRDLQAGRIGLGFLMDNARCHQDTQRQLIRRPSLLRQLTRWRPFRQRNG